MQQLSSNPNSTPIQLIDKLKDLNKQQTVYATYDNHAPQFSSDTIEPFFSSMGNSYMIGRILGILIVCILALFILKAMDFF